MRIGVIVNPRSGRRNAARLTSRIEHLASSWKGTLDLRVAGSSDRIESLARELAASVDALGALGGDGTLNGVVNGVLTSTRPDTPVFFVPAGRGKDTSRTLPAWEERLLVGDLPESRRRQVDIGKVTTPAGQERYFINESSIGVSAFAARRANTYPRMFGKASYLAGAMHGIAVEHPFRATLTTVEGTTHDLERCHIIAVSNGRFFGGGLEISPRADMNDGLLNIVALADASLRDIAAALPRLFRATHLDHPKVLHIPTAGVTIDSTDRPKLESDGEQWTSIPATFAIESQALTWLEPK